MVFIAHTKNPAGIEHTLQSHLIGVSEMMNSFTREPEYKEVFKLTGLLHDFGKYQPAFQRYLKEGGRKGSVPHANWGAALAKNFSQIEAAFAIDCHHKGLTDVSSLQDDCDEITSIDLSLFESLKCVFLQEIDLSEITLTHQNNLSSGERELFIRFLFSSLTDADWLDTEKHFDNNKNILRNAPDLDPDFLIEKLEEEIVSKSKKGKINKLRNSIREYAISLATGSSGFYSMTVPTGMGKTLASLSWALRHARFNNLERIIIVLPYISIIDQTAKELKRIFGEEWILEHHSGFNEDEESAQEIGAETFSLKAYEKRLATENWNYPIIVTTTVQFFESLFANKPSRCRKVHNIARSVIIFDEVQTLPKEIVLPTLSLLRDVQKIMNTSFLFCTATQPAFEKSQSFNGIDKIISLVENPKEIFDATKRVNYNSLNHYRPVILSELADTVLGIKKSTLVIFNTKKQALLFFNEIQDKSEYRTFHLSTSMYPVHRKRTIERIHDCLKNNEKILVASTQLIEAGVDFDFPCVFREIAPLESIIQSAGRCNREGKMDKGEVYIFSLQERPGAMKQYYSLADFANTLYNGKEELLFEHDFFEEYYRKVFRLFIPEDKYGIEQSRCSFNFKKVAESYHLIDSPAKPIFILCEESRDLYENIRHKPALSRDDFRKMQQFSVQVYDNFFRDNIGKLGKEPQGYWLWHGDYNIDCGITTENPLLIF